MRIPVALTSLLLLSAVLLTAAPASAGPDCWKDPVTQQSPCSWVCTGSALECFLVELVLFPCEHPGIQCP